MEWNGRQVKIMEALCRFAGIPVSIDRLSDEEGVTDFDEALVRLTPFDRQRLDIIGQRYSCAGSEHPECRRFDVNETQQVCSDVAVALVEVALYRIGREWGTCVNDSGDFDEFNAMARALLDDVGRVVGKTVPFNWVHIAKGLSNPDMGEDSPAWAQVERMVHDRFHKTCPIKRNANAEIAASQLAMSG